MSSSVLSAASLEAIALPHWAPPSTKLQHGLCCCSTVLGQLLWKQASEAVESQYIRWWPHSRDFNSRPNTKSKLVGLKCKQTEVLNTGWSGFWCFCVRLNRGTWFSNPLTVTDTQGTFATPAPMHKAPRHNFFVWNKQVAALKSAILFITSSCCLLSSNPPHW